VISATRREHASTGGASGVRDWWLARDSKLNPGKAFDIVIMGSALINAETGLVAFSTKMSG
jgi:hypothetical protein